MSKQQQQPQRQEDKKKSSNHNNINKPTNYSLPIKKQKITEVKSSKPKVDETKKKKNENIPNPNLNPQNDDDDGAILRMTPWSKSKKKRMRKLKAKQQVSSSSASASTSKPTMMSAVSSAENQSSVVIAAAMNTVTEHGKNESENENLKKHNQLIESFKNRLSGGRFRELNELLYTAESQVSFSKFTSEPELFEQYHKGFRNQIQSWPVNPIDVICKWLIKLRSNSAYDTSITVADFGCGDAKLAQQLLSHGERFKVHSFDLVAPSNENHDLVTPCDMSNVPLKNNSVDIAVFSLALMGTNIADFLREAHRVLRVGGSIKIAEVRSRFEGTRDIPEDENTSTSKKKKKKEKKRSLLEEFIDIMTEKLGFELVHMDNRSNKLFFLMEFSKRNVRPDPKINFTAKACIYKRR